MERIYHLVVPSTWYSASHEDLMVASLVDEGFIHCAFGSQVAWAANRFYRDVPALLALEIDASRLTSPLKVEPPPGKPSSDRLFPHIYGPLQRAAVVVVHELQRGPDGQWQFTP
ncbi:MAG: DUF952 domain-containing protein [Gemmataceae bacterium]